MTIADASALPPWRRPFALLAVMAAAMPLAFATWSALLNNFVVEMVAFDGFDIGALHSIREIPGFLAIGVIAIIIFVREQTLALISLAMLGVATMVTAQFPSFAGLMITTFIGSVGFHYFETVNQSLQLQWLKKDEAPRRMGVLLAVGSGASLAAYGLIVLTWETLGLSFDMVYLAGGGAALALVVFAWLAYPSFDSPEPQAKRFILRRRYWLYYLLQFIDGARRQIFMVFAAFMMVERFGFEVHELTGLFLINYLANMIFAPLVGRAVGRFGERRALVFEYVGLTLVFSAYAGIYFLGWGLLLAAALYVIDHLLFAMALAQRTYFQKIADPGDIAPTAAVAFTINHIAAVVLPVALGLLWLTSPGAVFALAALLALISVGLSLLIPRHPAPGRETVLASVSVAGARA